MSTEALIPINIVIGDRSYRIKIRQEDEEHVRKTLKLINDQILEYKTNFAGKDMQDYIAMVTIWYATQTQGNNGNPLELEQIKNALKEINKSFTI
jgi:cell division protein ZapA (FtsZ GTPase activity inhibitor)